MTAIPGVQPIPVERLREFVAIMSRLNEWARRPAAPVYPVPRPTASIYWAKEALLKELDLVPGLARHSRVEALVKCRDCGGSGRYTFDSGDVADHCWRCFSTGQVRLEFIQSEIFDGRYQWHTPAAYASSRWGSQTWARLVGDCPVPMVTDWSPQRPGKDYPMGEMITGLVTLRRALWPRHLMPERVLDEGLDLGPAMVGRDGPTPALSRACVLCGAATLPWAEGGRAETCMVTSGPVTWRAVVCSDCAPPPVRVGLFERLADLGPHEELLAIPGVRTWIALACERPRPGVIVPGWARPILRQEVLGE